ncbi:MAG: hypothetical protein R3D33_07880 [Hyphomicrobiaceae bacterium]
MNILAKSVVALGIAASMAATTFDAADARSRHHGGRFVGGLITGLVAGSILYNATRPHYSNGYYVNEEPECYRGPRQCQSHWNCWVNRWGREVCDRQVSCYRPLVCD